MSRYKFALWVLAAVPLAGCGANQVSRSSQLAEQNLAASCRSVEARAKAAANPNASTILMHSKLQKKADDLRTASLTQNLHGAQLEAAMGRIAQAQIEADAIYDVKENEQIASECWRDLEVEKEMHHDMQQRLSQMANESSDTRAPIELFRPLETLSPPPTPPIDSTTSGMNAPASEPKTWMDTPYAPMIPPVMRDQPVANDNPAVPPVAR